MAHNNSFDFAAFCFHLPDPFFQQAHLRYISNLITGVLNAFFAPFAVIANVLVCFAIIVNPSLRSPSCLLIACLALSEILVSGIVQPSYVAYRLGEIHQGYVRCMTRTLYAKGFYICYGVSVTTLSAISFDRYLALRLHRPSLQRPRHCETRFNGNHLHLGSQHCARISTVVTQCNRPRPAPVFVVGFPHHCGDFATENPRHRSPPSASNYETTAATVFL